MAIYRFFAKSIHRQDAAGGNWTELDRDEANALLATLGQNAGVVPVAAQFPSVTRRILDIEDALANALNRGDFEIVTHDGERFLRPILAGHVSDVDAINTYPLLPLNLVARDLERLLS